MKFKNPLLAVADLEKSKAFYKEVLGLRVVTDFGANVTLSGGVCLQTLDTWRSFIGAEADDIVFGSQSYEIYFEEDDFDGFLKKLENISHLEYVHQPLEHRWGQRVVRFYDPDRHIIEVGENLKFVCRRFLENGMTPEQTASRMDVPLKFVNSCIKK